MLYSQFKIRDLGSKLGLNIQKEILYFLIRCRKYSRPPGCSKRCQ
jgi:hypothetical protein